MRRSRVEVQVMVVWQVKQLAQAITALIMVLVVAAQTDHLQAAMVRQVLCMSGLRSDYG